MSAAADEKCYVCGKRFVPKNPGQSMCSRECVRTKFKRLRAAAQARKAPEGGGGG